MITLTAKIETGVGDNSKLITATSNYKNKTTANSIENVLGEVRAKKPYIGLNDSNQDGLFSYTEEKTNSNIFAKQYYNYYRPMGRVGRELAFYIGSTFNGLPLFFTEGTTIQYNKITAKTKAGKIIASYPSQEGDLFRIEPETIEPEPNKGYEGFSVYLYVSQKAMETISENDFDKMLFNSTWDFDIYVDGTYYTINTNYNIILSTTTDLTDFWISFDTSGNGYPTKMIIDGVECSATSPTFHAKNLIGESTHTIQVLEWNNPNSQFVISGIYSEINLEIDRKNIIALECSIFDRSDLSLPSYGIISNKGRVEFNDINRNILQFIEEGVLSKGLNCEILLKNTVVENASERIGLFETDKWSYDNDNKVASVTLKDDLEEWQEINVKGIEYDIRNPKSKNFRWLYNYLWELTNPNYPMLRDDELDEETYNILNNVYIQYPLLKSATLWQQWTKLCQACQLHIYKNNDGVIVCRYNGGN